MIKEFILSILFKNLSFVKKLIYPQKKFKDDIEIDVRSSQPITFTLGYRIPTSAIYLKITNKSQYLEAIFDRAILSVWLRHDKGFQPIIKQAPIIFKKSIRQKQSEEIFCEFELNEAQVNYLREIKQSKETTATLDLEFYIDSLLYHFNRKIYLDNKPCKIEG